MQIFVNYIQKLKDTLNVENLDTGGLSSRSIKHRKNIVRNKSEHQLNVSNPNKTKKRIPLKDISYNHQNVSKMTNNSAAQKKTTNSSSYYCETEPAYTEVKEFNRNHQYFKEEDFEKIVEYTESDEDGQNEEDEDNKQNLQFCEEIEEVDDESIQQSIIMLQEQKIGPQSFEPISLLG